MNGSLNCSVGIISDTIIATPQQLKLMPWEQCHTSIEYITVTMIGFILYKHGVFLRIWTNEENPIDV